MKKKHHPLIAHRNIAFGSAAFSMIVWPHELLLLHYYAHLEIDLIKALLTYMFTIAGTSIGSYLWATRATSIWNQNPPMCEPPPNNLPGD